MVRIFELLYHNKQSKCTCLPRKNSVSEEHTSLKYEKISEYFIVGHFQSVILSNDARSVKIIFNWEYLGYIKCYL